LDFDLLIGLINSTKKCNTFVTEYSSMDRKIQENNGRYRMLFIF
jgi:hypothetical protein